MTTTDAYKDKLRQFAQSILEGVQKLEEQDVTVDDDKFSDLLHALIEADSAAWGLAEWISEGRPDTV